MAREPTTLALYRLATGALAPFAPLLLRQRLSRGKEDRARLGERYGRTTLERPDGPLAWVHAASVGELMAAVPLVEAIIAGGVGCLVTTGTVTSAAIAARRLPAGALHQYVPLDGARFVGRFLDHWRPGLALFIESELWPNTIGAAHRRRIPVVVVNARMSDRSFRRWAKARRTIATLLGQIDLCLAQTEADAGRYAALGAPRTTAAGNLKFDVPPPAFDAAALEALRAATAGRPVVLAASTHPGEDEVAIEAHARLALRLVNPLTVIVPRHPERGEAIAAAAGAAGFTVARRSTGALPEPGTAVYVADTLGELGLFYRRADVAFVGGSLTERGGQNPIEPAKLATPILHGPHVRNFAEVYAALDTAKGALTVTDAATIAAAAAKLFEDEPLRRATVAAASGVVDRFSGALGRTLAILEPYLLQLRLGRA